MYPKRGRDDSPFTRVVRPNHPDKMTKIGDILVDGTPQIPAPRELFWICDTCGEVAPRTTPTGRWIKMSCACQIAARKAEKERIAHQEWDEKTCVRTFGGWLGGSWDKQSIQEMRKKTFLTFDPTLQLRAYEAASAFANDPQGNLLFYGDLGTGKTHLEAAICNFLRDAGIASLFTSAPQFFQAYLDASTHFDKSELIKLQDQAIGTPVLVLDDADKAHATEARLEAYFIILDGRYKARRPTIISTNRRDILHTYIGEAGLSRFTRGLTSIEMVGDDYRLEEEI